MKQDIAIPQGLYKVGRDLHEGVYLIAGLNEYAAVYLKGPNRSYESYSLDEENTKIAHIEISNGDSMEISGRVIMRQVTRFIEDDKCNLFDEIAKFENDLRARGVKLQPAIPAVKTPTPTAKSTSSSNTHKKTPSKQQNSGFWSALSELFDALSSSPSTSASQQSTPKKKHSGKCDGDCANCPPHYGYRHGRWYYGHDHIEGCEFGGNKGSGSKD